MSDGWASNSVRERVGRSLPRMQLEFAGISYAPWSVAGETLAAQDVAGRLKCVSADGSPQRVRFDLAFDVPSRDGFEAVLRAEWPAAGLAAAHLVLHVPWLGLPNADGYEKKCG